MTTIAYHKESNTIALDSRATSGSLICDIDYNKKINIGGKVGFISGDDSEVESFIRIHRGMDNDMVHSVFNPKCIAFVIEDGLVYVYYIQDGEPRKYALYESHAIGSGAPHAITAMDLGCDAKKAVEMAAIRDTKTGGEIKVFEISEGK